MANVITPEDLLPSNYEFMMHNKRHGVLAPKAADDRWQALQAVADEMDRLMELYYQRAEAAEDAHLEAVSAHARADSTGKAVPAGTGVKVMDAKLAVEGTLSAFRATLPRLVAARKAYDALFEGRAFLAEYREAIAAEFLKRRASAVKAFNVLDAEIPALAELYALLGDFTLNGLLGESLSELTFNGEPVTDGNLFTENYDSWAAPKLSEHLSAVRRYVLSDDPIKGGTLLTEDLSTIADALPALAEQRYEEWQETLAAERMKMTHSSPYGSYSH